MALQAVVFNTVTNLFEVSATTNPALVWPTLTVTAGATLGIGQMIGIVNTGGAASAVLANSATYIGGSVTTPIPAVGFILDSYTSTQSATVFTEGIFSAAVPSATISNLGAQVYLSLASPGNISLNPPTPSNSWQATTAYTLGATILDTNDNWQVVTTAGTSGGTEPTNWSQSGGTTSDGSITWTNIPTPLEQVVGTILNFLNGLCVIAFHPFANVGDVSSVGLSAPSDFVVTGSPVISIGDLTFAWTNQAANTVKAGPASGSSGPTVWRNLVAADFGTGLTAHTFLAGPTSGTGAGSFRVIAIADLPFTGTASATTFGRGDGTWASAVQVLQVNGFSLSSQTTLNLQAGTNISITDNGSGEVTIANTASAGVTSLNSLTGALTITSSDLTVTPSGSTIAVSISNTGVVAGSYTTANITVNAAGQITSASNGSSMGGVTSVNAISGAVYITGTGITVTSGILGSPASETINLSLPASGVGAGTYTNATLTVNAEGIITAASNGSSTSGVTSVNSLTGTVLITGSGGLVVTTGTLGSPASETVNVALPTSGVTAGSYTNANIVVNAEGIVTSAANGSGASAATALMITNSTGSSNTTNTEYFAGPGFVRFDYFVLPCEVTFSNITAYISQGGFTSHTYDIGIYSLTGTLLCSTGGTNIPNSAAWNEFAMTNTTTLAPGGYFLATTGQDLTQVIMGYGNDSISPYSNGNVVNTTTGNVLPATATVPGSALTGTTPAYFPYPQFYLS